MTRLLIHVEGETEETFVNEVLAPHLYSRGYRRVSARLMGNARQRDRRGGIRPWIAVRQDIVDHLKEDPQCLAGSMVDYYALPQTGERAWPGRNKAGMLPFFQKAPIIQDALLAEICDAMGKGFIGLKKDEVAGQGGERDAVPEDAESRPIVASKPP